MEKKLLTKIYDYVCEGMSDAERKEVESAIYSSSTSIAMSIADYAHRNQKQLNGKPYVKHPEECLQLYRDFVGIVEENSFCVDIKLLEGLGVPFCGVQEVCLLHDVLEDTDVTMDEIRETFYDKHLNSYFDSFIFKPLALITHDKKVDYPTYMKEVLKHPISAMVKLMDLTNNMNLLRLDKLDGANQERFIKYYNCVLQIEREYFFIEKVNEYNKQFEANKIKYNKKDN